MKTADTSFATEALVVGDIRKKLLKHDFFEPRRREEYWLFFNKRGSYSIKLDFQKFLVDKPAFLVIEPGRVHQVLKIKDVQGYAIGFDKASVYSAMEQDLARISNIPIAINFDNLTKVSIALVDLLYDLQQLPANLFVTRASQGLLHSLLNVVASQSTTDLSFLSTKKKRASVIGNAFMMLLEKNYKTWKRPSRYAEALSISTNHLNDVVKALTGKSVTSHIHSQSMLEAKRLLHFTDLTIKEICYETGFRNTAYFNKLFKKITGMTPQGFRNKSRV